MVAPTATVGPAAVGQTATIPAAVVPNRALAAAVVVWDSWKTIASVH